MSMIFSFLPFNMWEFAIPLDPLEDAIGFVNDAVESLSSFGDKFDNLIDLDMDFMDTVVEAGEYVIEKVEGALPDFSTVFDCTDASCIFPDEFPLKIHGVDNVDTIIPTVEISGTNYSVPSDIQDIFEGIVEIGDDITSIFSELFASASCDSYETVTGIQPLGMLASFLGQTAEDIGLEDPSFSVRICSDMQFGNYSGIVGDVMEAIGDMVDGRSSRRRLSEHQRELIIWKDTWNCAQDFLSCAQDFLSAEICEKTEIGKSWGFSIVSNTFT